MEVFVTIAFLIVLVLILKKNQPAIPWKDKLKPSKGVIVFLVVLIIIGYSLVILVMSGKYVELQHAHWKMFFKIYLASWSLACIIAIFLMFNLRYELDLFQKTYWNGLFQSWKLITFLIATAGLTLIAPYSGDWSWDYVDAIFMSVFTFCSAPWVIGTLFLAFQRKRNFATAYIAICLWMFSASWSYDLYILIRDGNYPMTWFANIFASSSLYLAAGFFWNLEYIKDRGVVFGFMEPNWPRISSERSFKKVALYAFLFMLIPTVIIVPFLYLQYY